MSEQHITITDRTTASQVQAILGAIAAVIVSMLGVGFVPGFFVAALIDWLIPIHSGPLWGITLLVSLLLLGITWWICQRSFRQGIIRYTLSALGLLLVLIIVSLFLSGDVFFGYTLQKMFETSESNYQQIEQERGRLAIPKVQPTEEAANPPTISPDSSASSETEPATANVDPCQTLNDTRFTGMSGYYYLRLFHQKGSTYEFVGKVEARDINGFVKRDGDELVVTSGNVNGRFTLLNNCQELTGHFTDTYGTSTSFDYSRWNPE